MPAALATEFLARVEPVLPGLTAQWNGKATFDDWPRNPWTLGSYEQSGGYRALRTAPGPREGTVSQTLAEALSALGHDGSGLSATSVIRMKELWRTEWAEWSKRDLTGKRYLNAGEHTPWQIMHGLLAFRRRS